MNVSHRGVFTFNTPFNLIGSAKVYYTIVSIISIQEFRDTRPANYDAMYEDITDPDTVKASDLNNRVNVVGLRTDAGVTIYVPDIYLFSDTINNYTPFTKKAIIVDLGGFKEGEDFDPLLTEINALIRARLGVTTNATILNTSPETLVANSIINTIEADREVVRQANLVAFDNVDRLQQDIADYQDKISMYEDYITNCLP